MELELFIAFIVSFVTALVIAKYFRSFVSKIGLTGIDQQKSGKPVLPTSAGIPAFIGLFSGLMVFIFFFSLYPAYSSFAINVQALLLASLSVAIITTVGFLDDIYMQPEEGVKRSDTVEKRHGLRQWLKPVLTFFGAIPFMAVLYGFPGQSSIVFPFFGAIDFGIIYPLVLIPIGIVTVSNATNMLAGLNGLESGMMAIASFFLGLFAFTQNQFEAAAIAFTLSASLFAMLVYGFYPSKYLPGDSLTYFLGGAFASAVIIGNLELFGIILFLPWAIEAFLKLRYKFKARSFGDLQTDGTLKAPYGNVRSLTHIPMLLPSWLGLRSRFTEKQIVLLFYGVEIFVGLVALFAYPFLL